MKTAVVSWLAEKSKSFQEVLSASDANGLIFEEFVRLDAWMKENSTGGLSCLVANCSLNFKAALTSDSFVIVSQWMSLDAIHWMLSSSKISKF